MLGHVFRSRTYPHNQARVLCYILIKLCYILIKAPRLRRKIVAARSNARSRAIKLRKLYNQVGNVLKSCRRRTYHVKKLNLALKRATASRAETNRTEQQKVKFKPIHTCRLRMERRKHKTTVAKSFRPCNWQVIKVFKVCWKCSVMALAQSRGTLHRQAPALWSIALRNPGTVCRQVCSVATYCCA